LNHSNK